MGEITVGAITCHQVTDGGRIGDGENVHVFVTSGARGHGQQEQFRADGDADAGLGHDEGGHGVLRLKDEFGGEVVAVEILVDDASGAVAASKISVTSFEGALSIRVAITAAIILTAKPGISS